MCYSHFLFQSLHHRGQSIASSINFWLLHIVQIGIWSAQTTDGALIVSAVKR